MKLTIQPFHFETLIKRGYNMDMLYILSLIKTDVDISSMMKSSARISNLVKTMTNKGLITDELSITLKGEDLLDFTERESATLVLRSVDDQGFEKWWKAFPSTDQFEIRGKKFAASRGFKKSKQECKRKFESIILEGDITVEEMVACIETDVQIRIESSVKEGKNNLKYLQNTLTYLNQRTFESFLDIVRNKKDATVTSLDNRSVDI